MYKNNKYTQDHAALWQNGHVIDLHNKIPKSNTSEAFAINDVGDILVRDGKGIVYFVSKETATIMPKYQHSCLLEIQIMVIFLTN